MIVEIATHMPAKDFAEHLTAWCHAFDPGAVERDERKRDSEAYLHLSRIGDGMWRLDGLLPDEVGTQFKALLDAALRRVRAEAKKQERAEGEQGNGDSDTSGGSAGREKERTDDHDPEGSDADLFGDAGCVTGDGQNPGSSGREKERADGTDHPDDGGIGPLAGSDDEFAQETWPNGDDFDQVSRAKTHSEVIGIDVLGNPIYADETPTEAMDNRFGSRQNIDALRYLCNLLAPATNPDGTIALPQ